MQPLIDQGLSLEDLQHFSNEGQPLWYQHLIHVHTALHTLNVNLQLLVLHAPKPKAAHHKISPGALQQCAHIQDGHPSDALMHPASAALSQSALKGKAKGTGKLF